MAGRIGVAKWREELGLRNGGKNWGCEMAGRIGVAKWREELGLRNGGKNGVSPPWQHKNQKSQLTHKNTITNTVMTMAGVDALTTTFQHLPGHENLHTYRQFTTV
jgi:hypothetical protein